MNAIAPVGGTVLRLPWRRRPVDLRYAERLQIVPTPLILEVVLAQIVYARPLGRPSLIEGVGNTFHAGLVTAAIAQKDDIQETMGLVASADIGEQSLEGRLLEA